MRQLQVFFSTRAWRRWWWMRKLFPLAYSRYRDETRWTKSFNRESLIQNKRRHTQMTTNKSTE